jgi:hypothetical protein
MAKLNLSNRTSFFHAIRLRAIENCQLVVAARRQTAVLFGQMEQTGFLPKAATTLKISPDSAALIFSTHGKTGFVRH